MGSVLSFLDKCTARFEASRRAELADKQRAHRAEVVARLSEDTRLVYFIQCGDVIGPIKIGISHDVTQRLSTIQAYNPHVCKVLGTMPGGFLMEQAFHKRFRHSHIRGEWFHPEPFLLKFVSDLRDWFVVK